MIIPEDSPRAGPPFFIAFEHFPLKNYSGAVVSRWKKKYDTRVRSPILPDQLSLFYACVLPTLLRGEIVGVFGLLTPTCRNIC